MDIEWDGDSIFCKTQHPKKCGFAFFANYNCDVKGKFLKNGNSNLRDTSVSTEIYEHVKFKFCVIFK
jgi:hypothetical protein